MSEKKEDGYLKDVPKVCCSIRDCPGVSVKKLIVTTNTVLGEQTSEINVCKEHLLALNNTPHFSMGYKNGSFNY